MAIKKPAVPPPVELHIRCSPSEAERLAEIAARNYRSISAQGRIAFVEHIERYDSQQAERAAS